MAVICEHVKLFLFTLYLLFVKKQLNRLSSGPTDPSAAEDGRPTVPNSHMMNQATDSLL